MVVVVSASASASVSATTSYRSPLLAVLTSPAKLAERLDRKRVFKSNNNSNNTTNNNCATALSATPRKVLSLDIQRYAMGVAVVGHPTHYYCTHHQGDEQQRHRYQYRLPNLWTVDRKIQRDTIDRLWDAVRGHAICGFVVGWPLEVDTGKLGARCGRVIYTLEKLQQEALLTPSRPVCLYDPQNVVVEEPSRRRQDVWGRCPGYASAVASAATTAAGGGQRQWRADATGNCDENEVDHDDDDDVTYHFHALRGRSFHSKETVEAALRPLEIWDDFCRQAWPTIMTKLEERQETMTALQDDGKPPPFASALASRDQHDRTAGGRRGGRVRPAAAAGGSPRVAQKSSSHKTQSSSSSPSSPAAVTSTSTSTESPKTLFG